MTIFRDTDEGAAFIATAESRNTSPDVMRAIAFVSHDMADAIDTWNGASHNPIYSDRDFYAIATDNGRLNGANLHWGDRTLDQIMADGGAA